MSTTTFNSEQTWDAPVNFRRERWPASPTGTAEEFIMYAAAAQELLASSYWTQKIERGLQDSATGRVRTLRDHLASG